jgi:hypothetical protein
VETHARVGAALTTPGRAGTARRSGSGKQDEKVYARNQRVRLRKRRAGPEPGGSGPVSSARPSRWRRATPQPAGSGRSGRPGGRAAAYPWRGCRGIAGHRPRRPGGGERGKRPVAALPTFGWWAGASSAVGGGSWRSARSSPSTREACTWRRGTARLRWRVGRAGAAGEYRRPDLAVQAGYCGAERQRNRLLVTGLVESPVPGRPARRVRRAVRGNGLVGRRAPRPGPTLQPAPTASQLGPRNAGAVGAYGSKECADPRPAAPPRPPRRTDP